ncbi:MAG: acetyl-CoA carboxylase carboxyltransferase subunit alpha [Chloroflexota bacterium]
MTEHQTNNKTPIGSYRDMIPSGISHKTESVVEQRPDEGLPAWDRVKVARHPDRPHTLDYIQRLCTDFVELHGDRLFGDDAAIIGGPATFDGQTVMIIGQQKGRSTKENITRNFGMPQPEGYRKAERLMKHAARFGFPIITFIDTPGASPGVQGEERGIGQAIAQNILVMLQIEVPFIAVVIGEGGSGGALAIGVGDRILMLENSTYSVATPEAAAAILWRDAAQASDAARAMRITAPDLLEFGVIDEVIPEPKGETPAEIGAHNDPSATMDAVHEAISRHLADLQARFNLKTKKGARQLLEARRDKFRHMGRYAEIAEPGDAPPSENGREP